jgi:hypothetical protein
MGYSRGERSSGRGEGLLAGQGKDGTTEEAFVFVCLCVYGIALLGLTSLLSFATLCYAPACRAAICNYLL